MKCLDSIGSLDFAPWDGNPKSTAAGAIDDDGAFVGVISNRLVFSGLDVTAVLIGSDGMRLLQNGMFDLVIVDVIHSSLLFPAPYPPVFAFGPTAGGFAG